MQTGKVIFFDERKGYGFIARPEEQDIFFHAANVRTRAVVLKMGDEVAFNEEIGPRGPRATEVRLMGTPTRQANGGAWYPGHD